MVGTLYREHLSDSDLALLDAAADVRNAIGRDPEQLEALIGSPETYRLIFKVPGRDPLLRGSPFLLFAVLIHRVFRDLGHASFVEEWVGPRERVPVFDTVSLTAFAADPLRPSFLAHLLPSSTTLPPATTLV